jgi:hypothetical protein
MGVSITVYDDSEEVGETIEIRITWFKTERDGRCECHVGEQEGGHIWDYFRERDADECLRVKLLVSNPGGSSTTGQRKKKSIYIIFRRTLEIELEIWVSDAERVWRSAVLLWSEGPCTRGGGRTEGFLLVVRNVDAAAASYTRRGGEGLASWEN